MRKINADCFDEMTVMRKYAEILFLILLLCFFSSCQRKERDGRSHLVRPTAPDKEAQISYNLTLTGREEISCSGATKGETGDVNLSLRMRILPEKDGSAEIRFEYPVKNLPEGEIVFRPVGEVRDVRSDKSAGYVGDPRNMRLMYDILFPFSDEPVKMGEKWKRELVLKQGTPPAGFIESAVSGYGDLNGTSCLLVKSEFQIGDGGGGSELSINGGGLSYYDPEVKNYLKSEHKFNIRATSENGGVVIRLDGHISAVMAKNGKPLHSCRIYQPDSQKIIVKR